MPVLFSITNMLLMALCSSLISFVINCPRMLPCQVPSERVNHLPEPAVQLWQKVLPLGLIFFCASFNLTILQNLKDSIMVVAGGAETLPYLASFCVLPASVAFFVLYGKLVSVVQQDV